MDLVTVFVGAVGTVVALWGLLRGEFKGLRGEMGKLATGLRGEMGKLGTDLRGEMTQLRGEVRADIAELRGEVRADASDVRTDMRALGEKVDRVFTELLHHVQQGHPHGPPNQAA
jgi:hypothetical protein